MIIKHEDDIITVEVFGNGDLFISLTNPVQDEQATLIPKKKALKILEWLKEKYT